MQTSPFSPASPAICVYCKGGGVLLPPCAHPCCITLLTGGGDRSGEAAKVPGGRLRGGGRHPLLLPQSLMRPLFIPFLVFACGAADRSGRGKRSSSFFCCWGAGDHFSVSHYNFFGVKRKKTLPQKGCGKKLCISWCIDLSKMLHSTPQVGESIPVLFLS